MRMAKQVMPLKWQKLGETALDRRQFVNGPNRTSFFSLGIGLICCFSKLHPFWAENSRRVAKASQLSLHCTTSSFNPTVCPSNAPLLQTTFQSVASPNLDNRSLHQGLKNLHTSEIHKNSSHLVRTRGAGHQQRNTSVYQTGNRLIQENGHFLLSIMEVLDLPSFLLYYRLTSWLLALSRT